MTYPKNDFRDYLEHKGIPKAQWSSEARARFDALLEGRHRFKNKPKQSRYAGRKKKSDLDKAHRRGPSGAKTTKMPRSTNSSRSANVPTTHAPTPIDASKKKAAAARHRHLFKSLTSNSPFGFTPTSAKKPKGQDPKKKFVKKVRNTK